MLNLNRRVCLVVLSSLLLAQAGAAQSNSCASVHLQGLAKTLHNAVRNSPLPKATNILLQELASAPALYIKAHVKITIPAVEQAGSYEYWERGRNYRLSLGTGLNYPMADIAFDGRFFQGRTDPTMAHISRGDSRVVPFPDGPLTLALAPLRIENDSDCPGCQLRQADLRRTVKWRHEATAQLQAAEHKIGEGSFDAGAGRTGQVIGSGRLARLTWPTDKTTGQHLEVVLDDYQPVGRSGAWFPMAMIERQGSIVVEYTIEKLDLAPSFPDDVFDIYSNTPKLAFLAVDRSGTLHKRFLRYTPTPGLPPCGTEPFPPPGQ